MNLKKPLHMTMLTSDCVFIFKLIWLCSTPPCGPDWSWKTATPCSYVAVYTDQKTLKLGHMKEKHQNWDTLSCSVYVS